MCALPTACSDQGPESAPDDASQAPEAASPDAVLTADDGPADGTADDAAAPDTSELTRACDTAARVRSCASPLLADLAARPTAGSDLLYYVNRSYEIPASYPISSTSKWDPCSGTSPGVPHDLVCVPAPYNYGRTSLRSVAFESAAPAALTKTFDGLPVGRAGKIGFKALIDAARDQGLRLLIRSGYRSYATQATVFESWVAEERAAGYTDSVARLRASTYSAQPGHSEHQLGTTADMTYADASGRVYEGWDELVMGANPAIRWMTDNAHRFGIVLTYGRDKVAVTQYQWEPWHFRFVGVEAADAMRACALNTEEFLAARYRVAPLPPYAGESITLFDRLVMEDGAVPVTASPGETVRATRRVRNVGSTNWWTYQLRHRAGVPAAKDPVEVLCVPAGESLELEALVVAPDKPGSYTSDWRLFNRASAPVDQLVSFGLMVK